MHIYITFRHHVIVLQLPYIDVYRTPPAAYLTHLTHVIYSNSPPLPRVTSSLRRRTWQSLQSIPAGQLGPLMSVTASDTLGPLLSPPQLRALSRRHRALLEVISWCRESSREGHAVLVGEG